MGSPLGTFLIIVIMIELEPVIVKDLFNKRFPKFHIRYMMIR